MKYYVIYTANGNLAINEITEHSSVESAKAKYHDVCKLMWSDASVTDAYVAILDNTMTVIPEYHEGVHKTAQPTPEPTEG